MSWCGIQLVSRDGTQSGRPPLSLLRPRLASLSHTQPYREGERVVVLEGSWFPTPTPSLPHSPPHCLTPSLLSLPFPPSSLTPLLSLSPSLPPPPSLSSYQEDSPPPSPSPSLLCRWRSNRARNSPRWSPHPLISYQR